ncbi:MAG TPA: hypothetical protein VFP97_04750 [Chitinophagaceae bacterium]|nr:hypothetical protein [Chitinophagaceae bacterium]
MLYFHIKAYTATGCKGDGVDQLTGAFVWMVQGVAREGKVTTKKGTVTLIQ